MIEQDVPDFGLVRVSHLVADYNGTLAIDGELLPGLAEQLRQVARVLRIHVLTADTFGIAEAQLIRLPVEVRIVEASNQAQAKLAYVNSVGADKVVAVGNGRNDRLMLAAARIGIAVVQGEGAAVEATSSADVLTPNIGVALDLLLNPKRLVATLRS